MIGFFPTLYPDELLYSLLARYYAYSGYTAYTYAANILIENKSVKPSIEFISKLSPEVIKLLTRQASLAEIVEKHTLLPYYARFYPKQRLLTAYNGMLAEDKTCHNVVKRTPLKNGSFNYLRFCPLCAEDDLRLFGETYWHRSHQLPLVDVCPLHACRLVDSPVPITSIDSPSLVSADSAITSVEPVFSVGAMELRLSQYVLEVFHSSLNLSPSADIGAFLHSKLEHTKYVSRRGTKRNFSLLFKDFMSFYNEMPNHPLSLEWQLQCIFQDKRYSTYEVCMVAMFLDIPPSSLVEMNLPEHRQSELFDQRVFELRRKGYSYPEIAAIMNAPYDTVKPIGEGLYEKNGIRHSAKPVKTRKVTEPFTPDEELLPKVKGVLLSLQQEDKPVKITVNKVAKALNISVYKLRSAAKCCAEIGKYTESQEEYWARYVVWAARQIMAQGKNVNAWRLSAETNIRIRNLPRCLPYLESMTDDEELLKSILSAFEKKGNDI